jgi:DNA-binding XRE family transcriptional regulator
MTTTTAKEATSTRRTRPARPKRREGAAPPGPQRLRRYLARKEVSHADLADRLGVSRAMVGMLLAGSMPSLRLAVRIEEVAEIRCRDWV